jgi:hypothetical protein
MMMMTSASASGGDGGVAGSLSEVQRPAGSSTAIAKFCSTDGRALGFARAWRGSERSAEFAPVDHLRCPLVRARLGGAMPTDLLDLLERCGAMPTDLLDLLERCGWPHDSMVRSPAAPSPIPFS